MNDLENSIPRMLDAYRAAVLAKNVEAFMRLYDLRVRIFDTWGVWSYEGAAPWRKMIEEWFASLGSERVKVQMDDVKTMVERRTALVSAIVTYTGVSAAGEELRAMQNRFTWVLKRERSVWKIVHEHTSAPVSFKDSKAILRRESACWGC